MAMQTGLSGYTAEIGSGFMKGRFRWTEKYDVDTNTSDVTIYPQFKSTNYYGYSYYFSGSYDIDGTAVVSMSSSSGKNGVYISAQNSWLAPSVGAASFTKKGIAHAADGTKSITLRFNAVSGYNSKNSGGSGWTVSGSVTIALTNIPRGSTVSATDANVGAVSNLAVTQNVPGTTHSIQYAFGTLSGYITAAGGVSGTESKFSATTVKWIVPTTFYAQMKNASAAKCTLTVRTYQSGGAQLGEATSASMTVTTTQALSGPTVSGVVTDVNSVTVALTGSSAKLVKGYSTARAAITATAKNSASIKSKTVNGKAVGSSNYVDTAKNTAASFVFSATDSRGFSASATVKPTVVNYIPLTLAGTCTRSSPTASTAALKLSGNLFNASFGAVANALTVTYKIGSGSAVSLTPTKSGNTWSVSATLSGVDYTKAYTVTVTATDKLVTVTKSFALNPGTPVFDWGASDFKMNVTFNATKDIVLGNDANLQFTRPSADGGNTTCKAMAVYAGNSTGTGIVIGAGGRTIIGGGEAADNLRTTLGTAKTDDATEEMHIANDGAVQVHSNCQTIASRKTFKFETNGTITGPLGQFKQWKLLWTNPDANAVFPATDLTVADVKNYHLFFIQFKRDVKYLNRVSQLLYVPSQSAIWGWAQVGDFNREYSITRSSGVVHFSAGDNTSHLVPLYIFGIM